MLTVKSLLLPLGQVIMTTQECHVPYDRTKLSKVKLFYYV